VDLLVDLPRGMGLFGLARLQGELQQILDAPVELIPAADLKAGVRPLALADLVPL
jgi:predicted nucleotidyltransferase